jgi:hypothetical protein
LKSAAGSTKPSTKGATFRLSTEKLEQLRKAANGRAISPNTLFNQILKSYLEWYSLAAHAKLYYLPKSFLVRLLNELTDDELEQLAQGTAKMNLLTYAYIYAADLISLQFLRSRKHGRE